MCIHVFTRRRADALFPYIYVLQCVAVRCSVLQGVVGRCSVLQCVAVHTCIHGRGGNALFLYVYVLWCVAVRCSVLQYVAVCYSAYMYSHGTEEIRCSRMYIFICVAVRCSASQCVAIFKCMGGNMLCSRYFHVYNNKINVLHTTDSLEECVAVCCRALQCVAVHTCIHAEGR